MDAADGAGDGVIELANVAAQPRSWKFTGADLEDSEDYRVGQNVSSAGDIDGDGRADLLIGRWDIVFEPGPIYLITAAALATLDAIVFRYSDIKMSTEMVVSQLEVWQAFSPAVGGVLRV